MEGKPIISIKDFSGSGAGGIWFNNGLVAHNDNGVSQMVEDFRQVKIFDDTDTDNDCGAIMAIAYLKTLSGTPPQNYSLLLDNGGLFFSRRYVTTSISNKYAIGAATGCSNYPDLFQLPSGNLIYTRADYVGLVIRGKCKSSSSTTKIVDSAGRDFTTLGLGTGGGDLTSKVFNLKTGELKTITSISTTDSSNDTLNFDAGTANAENDEFIALVATKFDLTSGLTLPTFKAQEPTRANWARQIRQFDDYWFITSGNFLAILDSDESTFDNNYKQLPYGHQANAIEVNGDKILVASIDSNDAGHLLLWDGYSDGWLQIRKIGGNPKAIAPYESGFVYIIDGKLFYTDGYNDTLLGEYSDTNDVGSSTSNINPLFFNSLATSNGMVFCANNSSDYNRVFSGVYYWNKNYGWGYMPVLYATQNYWDTAYPSCIYKRESGTSRIEVGYLGGLNYLSFAGASTSTEDSKSFLYYVALPQEQQVKSIGLNVGVNPKYYSLTGLDQSCSITVNVGDGRTGITKYYPVVNVTDTTTVANTSGASYPAVTGKEILFLEGAVAGERSYITSIADAGTASEVWTISPAVTTTGNTIDVLQYMVDKTETKTISIANINQEQIFHLNKECLGNKLIIEVVIKGIANSFPVSIQGINIYG